MNTDTLTSSLAQVAIEDIALSSTNEMFRDSSDFNETEDLKELIDSIKQQGLLQPILLRGSDKAGKYILVAGERRFRACRHLKLASIPSFIRTMTADEAFELQLTENLQRKDVHPLKEARAFKYLHDTFKWTTSEIALRFGKGETYILQRIKLNTLIDEAAKDFSLNYMTLGHAIAIARLTPDDQKEVVKRCSNKYGQIKHYDSIHELEDYIQDHIVRDLKEASFDIKDPQLLPKAGSCLTCPKRSGHATLLFADIKDKDRCYDGACFNMKKNVGLFAKVKDLVEIKPDTIFLVDSHVYNSDNKLSPQIASFLSGNKIKTLDDFETYSYGSNKKKITGFMLNGDKAGKNIQVYIEGKSSDKSTTTAEKVDAKEAIARIKQRTKRAAELDDEKIHLQVVELLETNKKWMDDRKVQPSKAEKALIANIIYNHADWSTREDICKVLKIGGRMANRNEEKEIEIFKNLTDGDIAWMVRRIAVKQYSSAFNHDSSEGMLMRELAPSYGIPLTSIEAEQASIRVKREARAKERISELSKTKK